MYKNLKYSNNRTNEEEKCLSAVKKVENYEIQHHKYKTDNNLNYTQNNLNYTQEFNVI